MGVLEDIKKKDLKDLTLEDIQQADILINLKKSHAEITRQSGHTPSLYTHEDYQRLVAKWMDNIDAHEFKPNKLLDQMLCPNKVVHKKR